MAMQSYVGYAGILSVLGKAIDDVAHKNIPQGAAFPLDEAITNVAHRGLQFISAAQNDPKFNYFQAGTKLVSDIVKENFQLGRVGLSWLVHLDPDILPSESYLKNLNVKTSQLRRFKQAEGMPYEAQSVATGNPYMDMELKHFKRSEDVGEALQDLPSLIDTAIKKANGNPDILKAEFKKIKENNYETMPSLENAPITFHNYVKFIQKTQGDKAASDLIADYIRKRAINQIKSSVVPSLGSFSQR